MKAALTILTIFVCIVFPCKKGIAQTCNVTPGSNGVSSALASGVTIDGNMSDWAPFLNDPDNNSYDNTNGIDLDFLNISDPGRDLVRFTFTEDLNNLYFYLERAGSGSNTVDIVFYVDVNNNNLMDSREPVYHIDWHGSNGNVSISVLNYNPSLISSVLNTISLNLDGFMLMGTLSNRGNAGPGSSSGKAAPNGRSIEVKIPFTQLTRQNASGNVISQLAFAQDFKFHLSSINGNISSIPLPGSIDDNFGGCLTAPVTLSATLPIKLTDFSARYDKTNVSLTWESSMEYNFSHYVLENSSDGKVFNTTAMVFGAGVNGAGANYSYLDRSVYGRRGLIYYRLRMVDIDGKESYSAVRIVSLDEAIDPVSISSFPNPVNNELRITIPANWQNKKVVYEIINSNGQIAQSKAVANSSQTETINTSRLAPGFYIARVTCEEITTQQKIVKQ